MTTVSEGFWATRNSEPTGYYEAAHEKGDEVVWDERLNAWLAYSYKSCKEVFTTDDKMYGPVKADLLPPGAFIELQGGPRHVNFLTGAEHKKMHRWWAAQFSQARISEIRDSVIRPVLTSSLELLDGRDTAELVADINAALPFRIILALMDVELSEKEIAESLQVFYQRKVNTDSLVADPTAENLAGALESTRSVFRMLEPYIQARRSGEGSDFISTLWRDGPSLLDDWSIEDVRTQCLTFFTGAGEAMTGASNNLFHAVVTHPGLKPGIMNGDTDFIANVVEESFRMYGPVHFRERKALEDLQLRNAHIAKGDMVLAMTGAAARDDRHYGCPFEFQTDRERPRDHLSFAAGSRACVGSPLARAILQELLPMVVRRWPHLRLDSAREAPRFDGFIVRSYQPLHVRLDDPTGTSA